MRSHARIVARKISKGTTLCMRDEVFTVPVWITLWTL